MRKQSGMGDPRWRNGLVLVVAGMGWLLGGCQFDSARMGQDRWEFSGGQATTWTSPNAEVTLLANGIGLTPRKDPPILRSGPLSLDLRDYRRLTVSLRTERASEGLLGLVVDTGGGTKRLSLRFTTRGETMETLDLDLSGLPLGVVREAVLIPSLVPQPVAVGSVRFVAVSVASLLGEAVSPNPGVSLALAGSSINFVEPPSIRGRSLWHWLFFAIVVLAIVVFGLRGTAGWRVAIRTRAAQGLMAIWGLGVGFLIYHQSVALGIDVQRFWGLSADEAYHTMDGAPLSRDMRDVAAMATARDSIELIVHEADSLGQYWRGRAGYYLAPVPLVLSDATLRLHYFAGAHAPCGTLESDLVLVREAERFCLFRVRAT
ncbi:MAG: hypothetical protein ACOYXR_06940 [Nitrospirota bacterium]